MTRPIVAIQSEPPRPGASPRPPRPPSERPSAAVPTAETRAPNFSEPDNSPPVATSFETTEPAFIEPAPPAALVAAVEPIEAAPADVEPAEQASPPSESAEPAPIPEQVLAASASISDPRLGPEITIDVSDAEAAEQPPGIEPEGEQPELSHSVSTSDLDEQWAVETATGPSGAAEASSSGQPEPAPVTEDSEQAFMQELRPRKKRSKLAISALVISVLGAATAAVLWFQPKLPFALPLPLARSGSLTVSATDPSGQPLRAAKVTVDGVLKCERFPCTVAEVGAGNHTIRLATDAYGTVQRVVGVKPGRDHSVEFFLEQPPSPPASAASAAVARAEPIPVERFADEPEQAAETQPANSAAARTNKHKAKMGTIRANSIPISEVAVDGRVVGNTPISTDVRVGSHNVVFNHAELGQRQIVVQVKPNQDAVASVLFNQREQ